MWYNVVIRYLKTVDDKAKIVKEHYLIDAVSFTDAEKIAYEVIGQSIKDFIIEKVSKAPFVDVFHYEDSETWYKCKVSYLTVDEISGKEKRISPQMLVAASNPLQAYTRLQDTLKTWTVPCDITDINITPIVEVVFYAEAEPPEPQATEGYVDNEF